MLLAVTEIREQLFEVLKRSFEIYKQIGRSIDFTGFEIAKCLLRSFHDKDVEWHVANVRIDHDGDIKLIDSRLLDPSHAIFCARWYVRLLVDLQHESLARVLEPFYPDVGSLKPRSSLLSRALMRLGFWHKENMPKILEAIESVRKRLI
jgi:hypothetical protein